MTLIQRLVAMLQAVGPDMKAVLPWAAKSPPAGVVVGTTDQQDLSAKTLASPIIRGAAKFESIQQINANTATTQVNFTNGSKVQVWVTVNTTLQITTPGIGNYQVILIFATAGLSVTVSPVSYWLGATSQPALNNAAGGRNLLSFYSDGPFLYCGVAKLNAV